MYTLFLLSLILSSVVLVALASYLWWKHRQAPGVIAAIGLLVAVIVYSLAYLVQLSSSTLSDQILATRIQYFGIISVPVMWFAFSLHYSGHEKWLTRRNLIALAIIPIATVVLVWTNEFHGLMWYDTHLETSGPFLVIAKQYGLWFWVHSVYSISLILLGAISLARLLFQPLRLYRGQVIILLVGASIPLIWSVLFVFRLVPIYHIDLTPIAFMITGLAIVWGLSRFRLFDIVPLARDAVLNNMRDGIIALDTQNRFVNLNPAATSIIAYSASELVGKPVASAIPDQQDILELLLDVTGANREVEIGRTQRVYETYFTPMYDGQGHLVGRFFTLHDITERKLIEAQNRELEEKIQLTSRLATIGEVVSSIAHEINNPLVPVIGYADWLLERDIPEKIRGDLERINRGANRIAEVVDRLLEFAGRYESKRERVDVNQIIEDPLVLLARLLADNSIKVTTQLAPELPETMGDGGQLQEVFMNLIKNAGVAMNEFRNGGTLQIKAERVDDNIRISVKDDGPGIPEENLEKIFQPFFTTRRKGIGVGLGLSICRRMVNDHGGRIYVESEVGKGATFFVELPVVPQGEKHEPVAEPAPEPEKTSEARILVVDDEPEILGYLEELLSMEGYKVKVSATASDALEKLKREEFDIVLIDVKMPDMSGIELYQRVKEEAIPVFGNFIFMTGDILGGDTRDFLSSVEAPSLTKPFRSKELLDIITRFLGRT